MTTTTREQIQKEVKDNFTFFQQNKEMLLKEHLDKVVLIRHKQFIDYFDTEEDAIKAGRLKYKDDMFSIQKINEEHIDLGFMGYALF